MKQATPKLNVLSSAKLKLSLFNYLLLKKPIMKSKKLNTVKEIRTIRDRNYEETKDLSQKELLELYKTRGKAALEKFSKSSKVSD